MKELRKTVKMSIRLSVDWLVSATVASIVLFSFLKIIGFDADVLLKYAAIFLGLNVLIVIAASIGACLPQMVTKSPGELVSNLFIKED